jgi:trimeric autotransporter adhesin
MKNLHLKKTAETVAKKQFNNGLWIVAALSAISFTPLLSQTTSYDANTIPILGLNNAGFGVSALGSITKGENNTAIGIASMKSNTKGSFNTGTGTLALYGNTLGNNNTGIGAFALEVNTDGNNNTAMGTFAMKANTLGYDNTALGYKANGSSIGGTYNTAVGSLALAANLSTANTAFGFESMLNNTLGYYNAALGFQSLKSNTYGEYNVGVGPFSLLFNTTGGSNTAIGISALLDNVSGKYNTGLGAFSNVNAGNLYNSTAVGYGSLVNASYKIRLGNTTVTMVEGPVAYTVSDGRFKESVKEEVKGLTFIKRLRPVVYNFNTEKFQSFLVRNMSKENQAKYMNQDFSISTTIRQSGFIAQEVEKAALEVGYNFNGVHAPVDENDNYSLAYGQFVVPLVKAVQELDQQKSEQDQKIEKLIQELEIQKQVIQKLQDQAMVSAQTESNLKKLNYSLEQNEPNPFSQETVIKYTLPKETKKAYLAIYDLSGKQVNTFDLNDKGVITITTEKLVPGIYIYTIIADNTVLDTKRMHVSKK